MKNSISLFLLSLLFLFSLNSCEVIGGIFKAGMWVGILVVVVIIVVIIWIISRFRQKP